MENKIPQYIKDWLDIIENMKNDNTYKLAWGRAIIECVEQGLYTSKNTEVIISFNSIAEKMLKYYWNQTFFFKLKQSSKTIKSPVIVQLTKQLIQEYEDKNGTKVPVWYEVCRKQFCNTNTFSSIIKRIANVLPQNVSYRFLITANKTYKIYKYDRGNKFITLTISQMQLLKEYSVVISQLLNYKWAQLLEKYNYAPRISLKVKGLSDSKIRRNNLTVYKKALLKQFKEDNIIDFYTGKKLSPTDISIDHVIPWSYIYSDDIWNLVVTSKSMNSKKSNSIPSQDTIKRLEDRNKILINYLEDSDKKYIQDIKYANDSKIVDKMYYDCRL